jgi:hypothetical protein
MSTHVNSSAYSKTNYVARSAEYKARQTARSRVRPGAPVSTMVVADVSTAAGFIERVCGPCGAITRDYEDAPNPKCFDCAHAANPYAAKAVQMSVDATGEDSTDPRRVADKTAEFNVALPPVEGAIIGKDAYGQTRRKLRPVAHNEVTSARRLKERAKEANLTPLDTQKRALPR